MIMRIVPTNLPGVLLLEPDVHRDTRGFFAETFQSARFGQQGLPAEFVQDNVAGSVSGVLRGLHFQHPQGQGKLVHVLRGEIFDVAVDIRRGSPTFGRWVGVTLSEDVSRQLYVPAGFAHGYCVTGDRALVAYKCTRSYEPSADRSVRWNDPDLAIAWPLASPLLSQRDAAAPRLCELPEDFLPAYAPPVEPARHAA